MASARHDGDMVFTAQLLLSHISRFMTLAPGDLVATDGHPAAGPSPHPSWLKPADGAHPALRTESW